MYSTVKNTITHNLINIPGWKTNRKIVVIESDDWGCIRMPSRDIYENLLREGYNLNTNPYLKYDSLASENDLKLLFEVLSSFKDINGNPPVITANCVLVNPDFTKIKESGFREFHFELFTETLLTYQNHQKSFDLWKEGIKRRLFYPQFHCREHVNVAKWLNALQNGDKLIHKAFEHKMICISPKSTDMNFKYWESLDYIDEQGRNSTIESIKHGLILFENIFGFKSKSFIATSYTWGDYLHEVLKSEGVEYIQGIAKQKLPNIKDKGKMKRYKVHFTGQTNHLGQRFLVRNVFFEPTLITNFEEVITNCIERIEIAFKWGKPAIIGSHRMNYIGFIDPHNRDKNLNLLSILLTKILIKWPDVEFMTSDQLGDIIVAQPVKKK